jgi:CheY-like chemotaxis protein
MTRNAARRARNAPGRTQRGPEPPSRSSREEVAAVRKCRSVLYIDDDPDICVVVQATLCMLAGLDVYTAHSGEAGIDLAYEKRPDLIVLDVMMPGLDGPATFERIRQSPLIAQIPIIFMTAKVMPSEVAHFLGLGAIGVLSKPFDPLRIGEQLIDIWNQECMTREVTDRRGQAGVVAHVDALRERFLDRTRADVDRLRHLAQRARAECRTELAEMERVAHSIHGAGQMFGFPAVSTLGGAIEHLAESWLMAGKTGAEPAKTAALRILIEQLSGAVAAARALLPGKSATSLSNVEGTSAPR